MTTSTTATFGAAFADLERADLLAFREELATLAPQAAAVVQDTADNGLRIAGMTAGQAIRALDEMLASLSAAGGELDVE